MTLADEAPRLRGRIEATFGDTVTIKRAEATTSDTEGNPTRTLTTIATDVPCRISTPTAEQLQIAAQVGQRVDSVLTAAVDTDVQPGDIVTDGTDRWKVVTAHVSKVQLKANLERWTG